MSSSHVLVLAALAASALAGDVPAESKPTSDQDKVASFAKQFADKSPAQLSANCNAVAGTQFASCKAACNASGAEDAAQVTAKLDGVIKCVVDESQKQVHAAGDKTAADAAKQTLKDALLAKIANSGKSADKDVVDGKDGANKRCDERQTKFADLKKDIDDAVKKLGDAKSTPTERENAAKVIKDSAADPDKFHIKNVVLKNKRKDIVSNQVKKTHDKEGKDVKVRVICAKVQIAGDKVNTLRTKAKEINGDSEVELTGSDALEDADGSDDEIDGKRISVTKPKCRPKPKCVPKPPLPQPTGDVKPQPLPQPTGDVKPPQPQPTGEVKPPQPQPTGEVKPPQPQPTGEVKPQPSDVKPTEGVKPTSQPSGDVKATPPTAPAPTSAGAEIKPAPVPVKPPSHEAGTDAGEKAPADGSGSSGSPGTSGSGEQKPAPDSGSGSGESTKPSSGSGSGSDPTKPVPVDGDHATDHDETDCEEETDADSKKRHEGHDEEEEDCEEETEHDTDKTEEDDEKADQDHEVVEPPKPAAPAKTTKRQTAKVSCELFVPTTAGNSDLTNVQIAALLGDMDASVDTLDVVGEEDLAIAKPVIVTSIKDTPVAASASRVMGAAAAAVALVVAQLF